ncbi:unnamed protein product [Didymodactylos carnosus]|uniref:Uncharacterized protein n=1 Tax=Didymodactylos carnosus TaxID=1234261 RepID=A0A815IKE2_9BILA|nr:unnamed protein product [Didymodactylos carnosus]CAF4248600.1 unnamed protein product [Didymodactylos carnosus]
MGEVAANHDEEFFNEPEVYRPHPYTDAPEVVWDNYEEKIPPCSLEETLDVRENVQQALITETGNSNIYLEQIDLASYKSIREFLQTFESKYPKLDVLINNAAYTPSVNKTVTVDNLESNFAINIFSYYLLMQGLHSSLKKASPQARIVNVASNFAGHLGKCEQRDILRQQK